MAKVYIAGPMTGYPNLNFPAFHAAANRLRSQGHEVISPAEIEAADWHEGMRKDIVELLKCELVVTLEGWERSKGANLEVHIARELGMPVLSEARELVQA